MGNLLEQSSAWLAEKRRRHLSKPVTYQRGTVTTEVQAAIGRTVFEIDDGYGVLEKIESFFFRSET